MRVTIKMLARLKRVDFGRLTQNVFRFFTVYARLFCPTCAMPSDLEGQPLMCHTPLLL